MPSSRAAEGKCLYHGDGDLLLLHIKHDIKSHFRLMLPLLTLSSPFIALLIYVGAKLVAIPAAKFNLCGLSLDHCVSVGIGSVLIIRYGRRTAPLSVYYAMLPKMEKWRGKRSLL